MTAMQQDTPTPDNSKNNEASIEQAPASNEVQQSQPPPQPIDHQPVQSPIQMRSPVVLRQPLISNVLRGALFSPKDRPFIIGLEKDLMTFIESHTDSYLLRPMNSYYRLLTHQTAEYYGLGHTLNKEGNSIVVYKNFGSELTAPMPLFSIPLDPQMVMMQPQPQQQFIYPQGATPGVPAGVPAVPGVPTGPLPMGYGFVPQYYPQGVPFQQQFHKNAYGNRYQPRHFNNNNTSNKYNGQPQRKQQPAAATAEAVQEEKPTSAAPIKLMKRSDEEDEKEKEEATEEKEETVDAPKKDAETLANERATREFEYQKARERIFQDGEDQDEEDLADDLENLSVNNGSNSSPNLPRSLPSQPQHYGGYMPNNLPHMIPGAIPQQFYYNQGYPPVLMYDTSNYGSQPVYYNQVPYNSGHRKKNHNGYRNRNNGYNHRNGEESKVNKGKESEVEETS